MKIVALDFETANNYLESACSLGITIYEDSEIIDSFEWLIRPPERYNYFTNSHIHLLTKEDVINEKEFIEYYFILEDILKDALIIAHNTSFDLKVLNSLCDYYELKHFNNNYLDTVSLSRRAFPELYNHRLDNICAYLDIDLKHHNAKADSNACLMILLKAMERYNLFDIELLLKKLSIVMKKNK